MKKGFTLVELIAAIIVIGLIIGVLVPGVNKITAKAKLKSFEVGVQGYLKAASTDNFDRSQKKGSYLLENGVLTNINVYEKVDINTNVIEDKGYIYIDEKGKKSGVIYNNNYCARIDEDYIYYPYRCRYDKYENGHVIYYNPEKDKICAERNLNKTEDAKSGCLKWHIFNDDEKNPYVTMILDHDTTISVPYNSSNDASVMLEAKQQLLLDTTEWDKSIGPRLIKAEEITEIVGFDFNKLSEFLNLATSKKEENITMAEGTNPYKWLFNYTSGCKQYGCDVERTGEFGYWTSTKNNNMQVWHIRPNGTLHGLNQATSTKGIRPVITIPKILLES